MALEHLENCRGLERLELYDCQQVTRAGIKRMRVSVVPESMAPGPISKQTIKYKNQPPFSSFCPELVITQMDLTCSTGLLRLVQNFLI